MLNHAVDFIRPQKCSQNCSTQMEQVSLTVGEGVDQARIENGFDLECSVETGIWNSRSICRIARRASGSTSQQCRFAVGVILGVPALTAWRRQSRAM